MYQDQLENYIIKRIKLIIVHHRFLKITDRELYFYQLLLKNIPAQSENELKANYLIYHNRYISMFSDIIQQI